MLENLNIAVIKSNLKQIYIKRKTGEITKKQHFKTSDTVWPTIHDINIYFSNQAFKFR